MDILLRPDGARVGFPLIASEEIAFHHRESQSQNRNNVAPALPERTSDRRGRRETDGEGVEEVREGD